MQIREGLDQRGSSRGVVIRLFADRNEVRFRARERDVPIKLCRERPVGVDNGGVDRPLREMIHRIDGDDKRHRPLSRMTP